MRDYAKELLTAVGTNGVPKTLAAVESIRCPLHDLGADVVVARDDTANVFVFCNYKEC